MRFTLSDGRTVTNSVRWRYEPEPDNDCWIFTGSKDRLGYGKVSTTWPDGRRSSTNAHRVFYEVHIGPIPPGLQLDHLCRNPACVNPGHLEPVTNGENVRRAVWAERPTCPSGHVLVGPNLMQRGGSRRCRLCHQRRDAERKRAWRAANPDALRERNQAYYLANREVLVDDQKRLSFLELISLQTRLLSMQRRSTVQKG